VTAATSPAPVLGHRVLRGPQCAGFTTYDGLTGKRIPPRQCRLNAQAGSLYCWKHAPLATRPVITVADGGWCIFCGQPAARYASDRPGEAVTIDLCRAHQRAFARALSIPRRGA